MSAFRLTNLTRQIEIGANCYLLETAGKRIVLDCGAHPKMEGLETLPMIEQLKEKPLDAIILTHAHQDHLGSLPVLMRHHPKTPVFTTEPTLQMADVMLHNSVNVMMRRREQGHKDYPLFTHREATNCIKRFHPVPLRHKFNLLGERLKPDEPCELSFQFHDAGHILGSVSVLIESQGERLLYTGDINFKDQTLMSGAKFPAEKLDVVIIESTRGATPEPPGFTRDQEEIRFINAIKEVFAEGGSVLIPVFALGKTQELLTMIHQFRSKGLFPECPIYIGGLGSKLTTIHDRLSTASHRKHPRLELLDAVGPFTITGREVNQYPVRPGRIYALSSGMMTENTLSNVISNQFIPNPAHGIFFIGYADPESPAGKLRALEKGASINMAPDSEPETLRCRVETFNFSSHGSRESFVEQLLLAKPGKIVFVHGDPAANDWFHQTLKTELPETQLFTPEPGVPLDL